MKQLEPKAVWLFFIGYILRWTFISIFLSAWASPFIGAFLAITRGRGNEISGLSEFVSSYIATFIVIWVIGALLCYVWARLSYNYYRYELTEMGFRKESGVIIKAYVTIPYDRIQNVDIYRGITARLLGLSDLHIQTAGASAVVGRYGSIGMGAEGRLPGLSIEVAEQMRDELIRRARQPKNQGL